MQQNDVSKTKPNKKLLYIGLPLAVVIPLLIASWLIGPNSIYIWVGVGLGMLFVTWQLKRRQKKFLPAKEESEQ